jgi:hypothetical protein
MDTLQCPHQLHGAMSFFEILIVAHVVKFSVFLHNEMAHYRVQKGLHMVTSWAW